MLDRCIGHCCRAFYLGFTPEELIRALLGSLTEEGTWFDDEGTKRGRINEIETIALMAIPIGRGPGEIRHARYDLPEDRSWFWYTCRNLQADGNCGIYERRPKMCRDYPYGIGCRYLDCTWSPVRRLYQDETTAVQDEVLFEVGGEG